jgi:nucleotide-binding universal stress UspA family protein
MDVSVETPAVADAPAPRMPAARKPQVRPTPEKVAHHAHLGLDGLRDYRTALTAEEANVSYWRRIIQARLDVVRAGSDLVSENLKPVLTDARVGAGRRALVEIVPIDDIPPLPDLAGLWDRQVDPSDAAALADLESALDEAEKQLSSYRTVLHKRLGEATSELIARYRDEPNLCLTALPAQPKRGRVA